MALAPDRAIFRAFPGLRAALPLVPLLDVPTPVRPLAGLEGEARSLHLKDDGRSAPPYGGNKPRKLEWLFGDARARGFSEFIAIGADGSNYCLASAVHGTRAGFDVTLLTLPQPPIDEVRANLLRGVATGARYVPTASDAALALELARRVAAGAARGRRPYATWFGGSSPLGAVGFVDAGLELLEQARAGALPRPTVVFVPTGSVGTHAGLEVAFALDEARGGGPRPRVVGIRVTPKVMGNPRVVAITADRCAALLHARDPAVPRVRVRAAGIEVRDGFFGAGYGLSTPAGEAARRRLGDHGTALDPTYSAKAMAGLLAATDGGELGGEHVVFWNTYNAVPSDALPIGSADALPALLRRRAFPER